jgi:very-short-patch-repair endonuclease
MKRPNVDRARASRNGQTDAERLMWRHLRNRALSGWKFRRQHEVGPYLVDFICADASLVVELDGGQHVEHALGDAKRTQWLERERYRVLRSWNDDVLKQRDIALEQILAALHDTAPHPDPLPGGERENGDAIDIPSPLRGEGWGEGKSTDRHNDQGLGHT